MKGHNVAATIVAVGAIAAAAAFTYNFIVESRAPNPVLPSAMALMQRAPAPDPRTINQNEAAIEPRAFRPIGPASTLGLNAREPDVSVMASNCSLLLRELGRQAVLLAARQDLHLPTRDRTLREGSPGAVLKKDEVSPDGAVLEIGSAAIEGKSMHIWVRGRAKDGTSQEVIDADVALPAKQSRIVDFASVTHSLEALSRREFPSALRKAGYTRPSSPQPTGAGTNEMEGVEKDLAVLSLVSQFAAVRRAHAWIETSGESQQALGALVRGYANLGQLTRFLWNSSHADFAARSLLYAERMVATDPGSGDALRHRSYARAMAGMHALALADLDAADRLDGGANAPSWAGMVRAFCRYDTAALSNTVLKAPEHAPLASFLCFLTVEHCRSQSAMMGFGKIAMQFNPLCLYVLDSMCARDGVSAGHVLTAAGPAVLAQSLETELPRISDLPQSVRDALPADARSWADPNRMVKVARALVEAGETDVAEPSWTVLGRMLQEAQFVHVWRRASFLIDEVNVDASGFVQASRPLVAGHPYAAFIDSLAGDANETQTKDLEVFDAEEGETPLVDFVESQSRRQRGSDLGVSLSFWMNAHKDGLAQDLEVDVARAASEQNVNMWVDRSAAERADIVDPFLPAAIAVRIEGNWPNISSRAAQIERDSGSQPDVGAALARQYHHLGRTADEIRVLQRYLKAAPDTWAFEMLAQCYLDRGDETSWLATLQKSLEHEDYGLDHAEVNQRIALHFMYAGRYDRAEPYARASAQSGAEWALGTADECFEGLGKWDEAEEVTRDAALRYGHPLTWYTWCVETGHGHLVDASRLMDQYAVGESDLRDPNRSEIFAIYRLGQGKTDEGVNRLRRLADRTGDTWASLQAALWCAANKDERGCDDMLDVARHGSRRLHQERVRVFLAELAGLFQKCRAAGIGAKLDLADIDELLGRAAESDQAAVLYFTAKFLDILGDTADARRYYVRCLATRSGGAASRMLAAMELRKAGIDPMAARYAAPKTALPKS